MTEITIEINTPIADLEELKQSKIALKEIQGTTKLSAVAKLSALGLTVDEIKALTGVEA